MSLLLDALKRAEQASKRETSLTLEPIEPESRPLSPPPPPLGGVTPGPTLGSAARRAEQAAAKAPPAPKQQTVQNRPLWILLGGLALLAIGAGVFWLWYVMSYPASPMPIVASNVTVPQKPLPAPTPPTGLTRPSVTPPSRATDKAPPPAAELEPTQEKPLANPISKKRANRAGINAEIIPPVRRSPPEQIAANPELASAYQALVQENYVLARQQYQSVIRNDPLNLDAFLGLATVAASTGDSAGAEAYYKKSLEIDPKNTVAQAGLAAIRMKEAPTTSESQLRAQIANQPQNASPHSTLGHLYASQSRWNDAQQAFFEAYRLEPLIPDHAFNLAISLDHLGQSRLAREYYGKALSLAASRPAGFNSADIAARMNQLAP